MTPTDLRGPTAVLARTVLVALAATSLLAAAYTYVLWAMHLSTLRYNPGASLTLVTPPGTEALVPAGVTATSTTVEVMVDLTVASADQTFLAWQLGAWSGRYVLAILVLLSVALLCVLLLLRRRRARVGGVAPWWLAGLSALALAVGVGAPWALVHADRLVARAADVPTEGGFGDSWFVVPSWSLQDVDWWLVLLAVLGGLVAALLRRAHRAERDVEGLI